MPAAAGLPVGTLKDRGRSVEFYHEAQSHLRLQLLRPERDPSQEIPGAGFLALFRQLRDGKRARGAVDAQAQGAVRRGIHDHRPAVRSRLGRQVWKTLFPLW